MPRSFHGALLHGALAASLLLAPSCGKTPPAGPGVFVLGVVTRRVGQSAALVGAAAGLAALLVVQFVLPGQGVTIAWPWYALVGSSVTVVVALLVTPLLPRQEFRS